MNVLYTVAAALCTIVIWWQCAIKAWTASIVERRAHIIIAHLLHSKLMLSGRIPVFNVGILVLVFDTPTMPAAPTLNLD